MKLNSLINYSDNNPNKVKNYLKLKDLKPDLFQIVDLNTIILKSDNFQLKNVFTFNRIFTPHQNNYTFYKQAMLQTKEIALSGIDQLFIFMGPPNSGKTHALIGNQNDSGILMFLINELMEQKIHWKNEVSIKISMFQYRKQNFYDLLSRVHQPLQIRSNRKKSILSNLLQLNIIDFEDFLRLLKLAMFNNKQRDLLKFNNPVTMKDKTHFLVNIKVEGFNQLSCKHIKSSILMIDMDDYQLSPICQTKVDLMNLVFKFSDKSFNASKFCKILQRYFKNGKVKFIFTMNLCQEQNIANKQYFNISKVSKNIFVPFGNYQNAKIKEPSLSIYLPEKAILLHNICYKLIQQHYKSKLQFIIYKYNLFNIAYQQIKKNVKVKNIKEFYQSKTSEIMLISNWNRRQIRGLTIQMKLNKQKYFKEFQQLKVYENLNAFLNYLSCQYYQINFCQTTQFSQLIMNRNQFIKRMNNIKVQLKKCVIHQIFKHDFKVQDSQYGLHVIVKQAKLRNQNQYTNFKEQRKLKSIIQKKSMYKLKNNSKYESKYKISLSKFLEKPQQYEQSIQFYQNNNNEEQKTKLLRKKKLIKNNPFTKTFSKYYQNLIIKDNVASKRLEKLIQQN